MPLSFADACAQITSADSPFELVDAEVRGHTYKVFKHAPPSFADLWNATAARGDATFLVYEDETWSFGETIAAGHALGAALARDYGVQKGDRVTIAMRNYPEWITSVIGITSIGAVAVMVNAWWTAEELVYGFQDSGSTVTLCDEARLQRIAPHLADLGLRAIVARASGDLPEGAVHLADAVTPGETPDPVVIDTDDDATIMYTSGTTGNPKGAVATHRSHINALMAYACRGAVDTMRAAADLADRGEEATANDQPVFILAVPLFHITGFLPVMMGALAGGLKLVMMYKWDPERALELIEREKVSQFVGVPTMVQDLLECPRFEEFDTSSLRNVGGGGAAAAPELVNRVKSEIKGSSPGIGYGMTETCAYGTTNSGDDYLNRPTSAGRAIPMMQVKVVDENGDDVGTGVQGEICFYGPNIIRAYWNKPEATADAFYDGWLRTGDLGRIDDEGFVFIEDRAKDMVIRAGENIGCIEVEAAIAEHPAVYEVAVFGLPHDRLGEELACAVYVKPGETTTAGEIQSHVGERLAAFKVPSVVELRDEMLPRSPQGKILKRLIRDELTEQRANG